MLKMMTEKKELLQVILTRNGLLDQNGFIDINHIETQPASQSDHHFGSMMERLIVSFKTTQGHDVINSFIIKSKAPSGDLNDIAEMIRAFEVELEIYQKCLHNMNEILAKEEVEEIPWPRFYGCEDENMILEDLKSLDFRMLDKQGIMDIDHAKLAVEALAKFHALSMITIERELFDKNFLSPSVYAQNIPFMIDLHNSAFNGLILSIEKSWGKQWQTAAKRIKEASKKVGEKLKKQWEDTRGQFDVINHGDCWTNNMLFKYSTITGKPMHVKLVDFQLCHYNSPCWDLVHLLFTALLPETRDRHMTSILTAYADSLNKTCEKYDYKGNIPRITYLQETIQKLSYYAFVLSCSTLPILLVSSHEMNPQDETSETLEHVDNTGFHYPLYNFKIVRETMKSEITWFLETCEQEF